MSEQCFSCGLHHDPNEIACEYYVERLEADNLRLRGLDDTLRGEAQRQRDEYATQLTQALDANAALVEALEFAVQALDFTRQYVGEERLPAIEGWSWYDATIKARAALAKVTR